MFIFFGARLVLSGLSHECRVLLSVSVLLQIYCCACEYVVHFSVHIANSIMIALGLTSVMIMLELNQTQSWFLERHAPIAN